jgi:outer membrane protein OmpA-like peptidoglycan-associated protein
MKKLRLPILVLAFWFALGLRPSFAAPDEYDDSQSHPLRILAYLVHPAAFVLEWTVFRPFHFLVSGAEPLEAVFGHKPHPPVLAEPAPDYDYGMPRRVPLKPTQMNRLPGSVKPAAESGAEKVKTAELPVQKPVTKEVPKIVELERFILPEFAFRFDSAELTDFGKAEIYHAAQKLKDKSDIVIAIGGHTDNLASEPYDQQLGMRRTQTIIKELVALGIDPARMSIARDRTGKPSVNQDTDRERAVNRPLELHVRAH